MFTEIIQDHLSFYNFAVNLKGGGAAWEASALAPPPPGKFSEELEKGKGKGKTREE